MSYEPPPLGPKELIIMAPALADIDEVLAYIAGRASAEAALRFADQIDRDLFHFASVGHAGVSRDWLASGLRMTMIGDYCVYFRVSATETVIIRFMRGSRDISRTDFDS
jgi:plasmid stabilization system protein ParE